jgi:hypothetical protein
MASNPGATPKKHAHAILESLPGLVCYAGKQLNWRFDKATGQRVPMSRAEDFFGCFDAIHVHPNDGWRLIQWSSLAGVYARRKKVAERFCEPLQAIAGPDLLQRVGSVEVWGWVRGSGFRFWRYNYLDVKVLGLQWAWTEGDMLYSPLLRNKTKGEKDA